MCSDKNALLQLLDDSEIRRIDKVLRELIWIVTLRQGREQTSLD